MFAVWTADGILSVRFPAIITRWMKSIPRLSHARSDKYLARDSRLAGRTAAGARHTASAILGTRRDAGGGFQRSAKGLAGADRYLEGGTAAERRTSGIDS